MMRDPMPPSNGLCARSCSAAASTSSSSAPSSIALAARLQRVVEFVDRVLVPHAAQRAQQSTDFVDEPAWRQPYPKLVYTNS